MPDYNTSKSQIVIIKLQQKIVPLIFPSLLNQKRSSHTKKKGKPLNPPHPKSTVLKLHALLYHLIQGPKEKKKNE